MPNRLSSRQALANRSPAGPGARGRSVAAGGWNGGSGPLSVMPCGPVARARGHSGTHNSPVPAMKTVADQVVRAQLAPAVGARITESEPEPEWADRKAVGFM